MSFTSEWVWNLIDKKKETSAAGGILFQRNAWNVSRSRFSDAAHDSELGETSASLDGENGGVTETTDGPTRPGVSFPTTQNWVRSTDQFLDSGMRVNERRVYIQDFDTTSLLNPNKIKVVFAAIDAALASRCLWVVTEFAPLDITEAFLAPLTNTTIPTNRALQGLLGFTINSDVGLFPDGYTAEGVTSPNINQNLFFDSYATLNGQPIYWNAISGGHSLWYDGADYIISLSTTVNASPSNYWSSATLVGTYSPAGGNTGSPVVTKGLKMVAAGSWSGTNYSIISGLQGKFHCVKDSQDYSDRSVPWYMQTQEWEYKDEWVVV